jgi:hypothetical protein
VPAGDWVDPREDPGMFLMTLVRAKKQLKRAHLDAEAVAVERYKDRLRAFTRFKSTGLLKLMGNCPDYDYRYVTYPSQ